MKYKGINDNYADFDGEPIEVPIKKKDVSFDWQDPQTFTYDCQSHVRSVTVNGVVSGDACTAEVSGQGTIVGNYTANAVLTGVKAGNYNLTGGNTAPFAITEKGVSVEWNSERTFTYNCQPQGPTIKAVKGVVDEDDCTVEVTGQGTTVGNYTANAVLTGTKAGNYKLTGDDAVAFTIIPTDTVQASLTDAQKPSAIDLTYNGDAQTLVTGPTTTPASYTIQYKVGEGNWSEKLPTGTDAKTYTVEIQYRSTDQNYADFDGDPIDVPIKQKLLGLSWGETSFPYDGLSHAPEATLDGVEAGDDNDCTVEVSGAQTEAGDNYPAIAILTGTKAGNYKLPDDPTTTFAITQNQSAKENMPDAQKPKANNLTYNGGSQELLTGPSNETEHYTIQYRVGEEAWSGTIPSRTAAGTYTVDVQYKSTDNNYADFDSDSIEVPIKQATLGLTWGQTRSFTYDGQSHAPTASLTGVFSGDEAECTVEVSGAETEAGENYTATAELKGEKAGNYKLPDDNTVEFSITKIETSKTDLIEGQKPTPKELTYNGTAQELVTSPDSLPTGYTIQYSRRADLERDGQRNERRQVRRSSEIRGRQQPC